MRNWPGKIDEWPLRVGRESGEWAAQRSDVAANPNAAAPAAHIGWVDASGAFFGQRYRMIWELGEAALIDEVEVTLEPATPQGLVLTIFHLELRR